MKKIFVYGTLKQGFGNYGVMQRAGGDKIGDFQTLPKFTMISLGGFPGVLEGGDTAIKGELYSVEDVLPLDRLEGHPTFYKRTVIELEGFDEPVESYILNPKYRDYNRPVVENGVWG